MGVMDFGVGAVFMFVGFLLAGILYFYWIIRQTQERVGLDKQQSMYPRISSRSLRCGSQSASAQSEGELDSYRTMGECDRLEVRVIGSTKAPAQGNSHGDSLPADTSCSH
jgi:hypothetical protein